MNQPPFLKRTRFPVTSMKKFISAVARLPQQTLDSASVHSAFLPLRAGTGHPCTPIPERKGLFANYRWHSTFPGETVLPSRKDPVGTERSCSSLPSRCDKVTNRP